MSRSRIREDFEDRAYISWGSFVALYSDSMGGQWLPWTRTSSFKRLQRTTLAVDCPQLDNAVVALESDSFTRLVHSLDDVLTPEVRARVLEERAFEDVGLANECRCAYSEDYEWCHVHGHPANHDGACKGRCFVCMCGEKTGLAWCFVHDRPSGTLSGTSGSDGKKRRRRA